MKGIAILLALAAVTAGGYALWSTTGTADSLDQSPGLLRRGAPLLASETPVAEEIGSRPPELTPPPPGGDSEIAVASASSRLPEAGSEETKKSDGADSVTRLTFERLAGFEYEVNFGDEDTSKEEREKQIPADLRALAGEPVVVEGYMIPLEMDGYRVKSFYLAGNLMGCCFGQIPKINEIVEVHMVEGKNAKFIQDILLTVSGTFEVGEEIDDYGYVTSIYRLQCESVETKWD